jgi:hypothetical protein
MKRPSLSLAIWPLLLLVALAFLMPLWHDALARPLAFVGAVGLLVFELAVLGICIRGEADGILIDARNCMSLSRLQTFVWMVLILAAVLVASAFNIALKYPEPLAHVAIPDNVLALLGISGGSLAAAPALLSLKATQTPSQSAIDAVSGQTNNRLYIGSLATNTDIGDARWTDMITGDEMGNFDAIDLSKVQHVLISLLLVTIYAMELWDLFAATGPTASLPELKGPFVWLMGISNASYLAYKASPHTTAASAAPATTVSGAGG